MLQIPCPHCGPRNQEEFSYERSVDSVVRLEDPADQAMTTLYSRANLKGEDAEIWVHAQGCGQWLRLVRDRVTHAFRDVEPL